MKSFSLTSSTLAVLGYLQHHGVAALWMPDTADSQVNIAARQSSWDGVTPQLIESAIDAMNDAWYNETDGRWNSTTAWWLTGNALQSVCDYMYATNDTQYLPMAEHTIQEQSGPLPWWPEGGGDFRADSTDDTGWWALALVRLYDLTGNQTYLDLAELDEAYIYSYWNATCGGGVIWDIPDLSYKNAISNELYMKLAASLANRVSGHSTPRGNTTTLGSSSSSSTADDYLAKAKASWAWFTGSSGLINGQTLINDGLTDNCTNNGDTEWTYNQGVILGAAAELYRATGDERYLATARRIADAVVGSTTLLSPDGVLYEYGCEPDADCDNNQQAFKGIFTRNLAELNVLLPDAPYAAYLEDNAQSVWTNDRDGSLYGIAWAGPYQAASVGTQSSAISLFVANVWS